MELLTTKLKNATQHLHKEAHTAASWIIDGNFDRIEYRSYLIELCHIYTCLEKRLHQRSFHPVIKNITHSALFRKDNLNSDIEQCQRTHFYKCKRDLITTSNFCKNIEECSIPGLVAHAWVRYFGDLSGGQSIAKIVRKKGLPTLFYKFSIDNLAEFKEDYCNAMNAIPLQYHDEIVEGALVAFRYNIELLKVCVPKNTDK